MTPARSAVQRHHRVPVASPEVNHAIGEVVPELGVYILAGRIKDPAAGMQEAVDAERAGFGTVWFSERYGLKDTGAISGAVAALTQRIRFASGVIVAGSRHPLLTATWRRPSRACSASVSLSDWAAATGHRSRRKEFRSYPFRPPASTPTFSVACGAARRSATTARPADTQTWR
jgi:hypothetical protein